MFCCFKDHMIMIGFSPRFVRTTSRLVSLAASYLAALMALWLGSMKSVSKRTHGKRLYSMSPPTTTTPPAPRHGPTVTDALQVVRSSQGVHCLCRYLYLMEIFNLFFLFSLRVTAFFWGWGGENKIMSLPINCRY